MSNFHLPTGHAGTDFYSDERYAKSINHYRLCYNGVAPSQPCPDPPNLPVGVETASRRMRALSKTGRKAADVLPAAFTFLKWGDPPARAARCLPRHEWRLYCATAQIIATACTARKRPGGRTTAAKGCVRQRLENAARGHSPQGIQGVLLHRPNGSTPTSASPGSSSRCEARFTPAPKL